MLEPVADAYLRSLGRRLRELRQDAALSQEELSARSGVAPKYISRIETGVVNPSIKVLRTLAERGLRVPLAAFFTFDVSADEARATAAEVSATVIALPKSERRRALWLLRAAFGKIPE